MLSSLITAVSRSTNISWATIEKILAHKSSDNELAREALCDMAVVDQLCEGAAPNSTVQRSPRQDPKKMRMLKKLTRQLALSGDEGEHLRKAIQKTVSVSKVS